ncbi:MAG: hypothetical protein U0350_46480 [Caldilineaceae bacterium]
MKIAGKSIKFQYIGFAALLSFGLMLGLFFTLQPSTVLAQNAPASGDTSQATAALPKQKGTGRIFKRVAQRFELTGTVVAANANSIQINLNLAQRRQQNGPRAQGVDASKPVTFTVDSATLLFDKSLKKIAPTDLQIGSTVTLFPKRLWGEPTLQLLFAGTPNDLTAVAYHGQLVEDRGDTLVLKPGNGASFNVTVDEATVWLDKGVEGRPVTLRPNLPLRVLGVKDATGNVKAALIAPLGWRR